MIASSLPPIVASPTRTTVLSGRRSSVINLYGLVTRITSTTPGRFSKRRPSIGPWFPVMPMAVRVATGMECARKPIASTSFTTASTSPAAAFGFITINIVSIRVRLFSSRRHQISPWKRERNQRPVEKRSLLIAKFRAPKGGRPEEYSRPPLKKAFQRSLPHYSNVPFVIVDSKLEPACPQAARLGGEPPQRTGRESRRKIDTSISLSPLD